MKIVEKVVTETRYHITNLELTNILAYHFKVDWKNIKVLYPCKECIETHPITAVITHTKTVEHERK